MSDDTAEPAEPVEPEASGMGEAVPVIAINTYITNVRWYDGHYMIEFDKLGDGTRPNPWTIRTEDLSVGRLMFYKRWWKINLLVTLIQHAETGEYVGIDAADEEVGLPAVLEATEGTISVFFKDLAILFGDTYHNLGEIRSEVYKALLREPTLRTRGRIANRYLRGRYRKKT